MNPSRDWDQIGLRTMTFPGTGGNPNPSSAPRKRDPKAGEIGHWNIPVQKDGIVLVGADGLLAAALRSISIRQPPSRIEAGVSISKSA